MKFEVNFRVVAKTQDKKVLNENDCRIISRWYYGVYLPKMPGIEMWEIPDYARGKDLYIEATYPVDDNIVVVLDCFGNKIEPMVSRGSVPSLSSESVVCRGSMMVFLMDVESRTVSIRKINVVEKDGSAVILRKRLLHKRVEVSEDGRFLPRSIDIPRDSFLSMFWRVLVDACNKVNVDNLMLGHNGNQVSARTVVVGKNGKTKTVLRMGTA